MVAGEGVPRPMAEGDVCKGAGSLPEGAGPRSMQPSDTDRQGELFLCGEPVDPHAQVLGRRLFRVVAEAAAVAFQACVVQMPPPSGQGGPRWWAGRLASRVGARPGCGPLLCSLSQARHP